MPNTRLSFEIEALYKEQYANWVLAALNYNDLDKIKLRRLQFSNCQIFIQFNPKRILSSAAKVDNQSIKARPCFLCTENRPAEQLGISYNNDYIILINPYPVFKRHITIPTIRHCPQAIMGNFTAMMDLARELPQYIILYNGPQCGASAPDHFHFQAFQMETMPIKADFKSEGCLRLKREVNGVQVFTWDNYLRSLITLRSNSCSAIEIVFDKLYKLMETNISCNGEPMMNILIWYDHSEWVVNIIPRKKHRPSQFYEQGIRQILTSPGSIDLSGMFVMAREEDYKKVTPCDIADIYQQVCVEDEIIQYLVNRLF